VTDRVLIPVCKGGRWGYIDRKGELAIQPAFTAAGEFQEGLALVCEGGQRGRGGDIQDGSWGFIDPSGNYISSLRFDEALDFEEGFAPAHVGGTLKYVPYDDDYYLSGGQWGFVDASGNWAMQPALGYTRGFHDGLAPAMQSGAYGFLDREFHWAIAPQYQLAYKFSEGVAAVWLDDKRWTYLDKQGTRLMEPRFDLAYSFSEGLAAGLDRTDYRYAFLNHSFADVFTAPAGVTHVGQFSEGLVWAILSSLRRMNDGSLYPMGTRNGYGYLDRKGEWAIRPQFDSATDFSEGLACVKDAKGQYGYIRADGSWAIPASFSEARPFRGGFAGVRIGDSYRVIDSLGNHVWSEAG
jgi:hypothetical protein